MWYILGGDDGKTPVREPDIDKYMAWVAAQEMKTGIGRTLALDEFKFGREGITVSTVFLGIDHAMGRPGPITFETMTFSSIDDLDGSQWRYRTWDEAVANHQKVVEGICEALGIPVPTDGFRASDTPARAANDVSTTH